MHGTVKNIVEPRGFGFITAPGVEDTFFHFTALDPSLDFDELLVGRRVEFELDDRSDRRRAAKVRPAP